MSSSQSSSSSPTFSKGLAGVIADESKVCTVGQKGLSLMYRGYNIKDLAQNCCFEEIAYLMIYGDLPNMKELTKYKQKLATYRFMPPGLKVMLELIPKDAHPMDVLRTACSMLGTFEGEIDALTQIQQQKSKKTSESTSSSGPSSPISLQGGSNKMDQYNIGDRLIALFGPIFLYWHHFHNSGIRIDTVTDENDSIASNFIKLLNYEKRDEKPNELVVRIVDVSLILYAEHGFAASTFANRVTISTLSDIYSGVCTAIGTLRGPLHGGANEAAYRLISSFSTPEEAEQGIMNKLKNKELIMGFGHRVYRKGDPRSPIIKACAKQLNDQLKKQGNLKSNLFDIAERIDQVMFREKKLYTNLDFYASIAYHMCGIPTNFFTPVFVIARTSGWVAHTIEQRSSNKLMRPLALYTGPQPKKFIPLEERNNTSK